MRILVIEPEHRPEVREIDGSLKSMQEIVGGLSSLFIWGILLSWSAMMRVSSWTCPPTVV